MTAHYVIYTILIGVMISLYLVFRVNSIYFSVDTILNIVIISAIAFSQWRFKALKEQPTNPPSLKSPVSFEENRYQAMTKSPVSFEENRHQAMTESLLNIHVGEISATEKVNILIFHVNTPLTDVSDFYGRKVESRMIIDRIKKGASTSIVGEQKSGKTWLLNYIFLKVRSEFDSREIKAGYINAAGPKLKTVSGFTNEALRVLNFSSTFTLPDDRSMTFLDAYIRDLVEAGQTPILFIDNFEAFTKQEEFNSRFFEALRAMTQIGLALIIVSRQSLIKIVSRSTNRSPFFNVFAQIKLSSFDSGEAQDFVRSKAIQAGFTEQEQEDMLQYGQDSSGRWPPLRLQLVGNMLLEKKDREHLDYEYDALKYSREFEKQVEKEYSMLSTR